ncbi:methionyl-tRNA formyltransferase [Mycoplasmoides fastidiosum]|uniref:Methionyl-tRNA formyltransferase n=1 Tax=Mycoplasmoides fastidiosum TaxID=92758 RepID=A0ABU0LXZ9_9BACT|nr:methionyl-tRNA formyltransferase [Mycoplasmoides fastidiosum]MDQ0513592.1 methionyl-tRNA formyltransferase [Mycoplasmoides fastidiosum]UUD37985.1 methionyl-tRNA formyltransferase [Mycoplasmoides fastidiosum]
MTKIVFLGTPEFGANTLQTLIAMNLTPILVVCQPDRHYNRKKEVIFSPVKQLALAHEIPVVQPEKVSQIYEQLVSLQPDLLLTAAYGQFIPEKILQIPRLGAWNVHGSLLPALRGGAPIQWAIINQLSETGVSLMRMVKKMDAGGVIAQEVIPISADETYQSLLKKFLLATTELLKNHFPKLINQQYHEVAQDESAVSFAYNIQPHEIYVDWHQPAAVIDALVRGLYNKPLAKTRYQDLEIKIHHLTYDATSHTDQAPGTIVSLDRNGIGVATADQKVLFLKVIQLPSKNPQEVRALINGKIPFEIHQKFSNFS